MPDDTKQPPVTLKKKEPQAETRPENPEISKPYPAPPQDSASVLSSDEIKEILSESDSNRLRERIFLALIQGAASSDALVTRALKKSEIEELSTHLVNFSALLAKKYQAQ